MLAQENVTSATKQLIAELLNYGAAAQEYVGANADALKAAITAANLSPAETFSTDEIIVSEGAEEIVAGATVNFSNDNKIVFVISKSSYESLGSYTVTINGETVGKDAWIASNNYYLWYSNGIKATAFGDSYKLVVTNENNETVQTIEISVNAYCAAAYKLDGASETLKNLLAATYNYGAAAKAYAESLK